MKKFILLLYIFFFYTKLFALTTPYLGIKGANFLKIGTSPRAEAMGSSFVSIIGGINSIYYNPAGVYKVKNKQIMLSTLDWIDNVNINYAAYAQPLKKIYGIIFSSFTFLYISPIIHYNSWGENIGEMNFYNISFTAGYSRLLYGYNIGVNLKFIFQKISDKNNFGIALDLGGIYHFKPFSINIFNRYTIIMRNFNVGLVVKNLGTKAGADSLPLSIDFGYSFRIVKNFNFSLTIIKPIYAWNSFIDADYKMNYGFEYIFQKIIYLRFGLKINYDIPNNFSMGFGVKTSFSNGIIIVDYAYAAYTYLEKTNRISLTLKLKKWEFWK